MPKDLRKGFQFDRSAVFVDDVGNPADVEDAAWSSSDDAVIALLETGDPLTITIQAIGAVGAQATVTVSGDADLGDGVVPVQGSDSIHIVAGQATSVSFTDTEPVPIEA